MKLVSAVAVAILTLGPGFARAQESSVQLASVQWGAAPGSGAYYYAHQPYGYGGGYYGRPYYPRASVTLGSPGFSLSFGLGPSIGIYGGSGYYGGYPGYYGGYPYGGYSGYYGGNPGYYYGGYPRYYGGYSGYNHPGYYRAYPSYQRGYQGYYGGYGHQGHGYYQGRGHYGGWHGHR